MPILVRTSFVAIQGVRVYFEDLKRLYDVLETAAGQKPKVAIHLRTAAREHVLSSLDEVKSYRPDDLRTLTVRSSTGAGGLTFHILENRITFSTTNSGVSDVADVVRDFERLEPPGRFSYLLRPKALNPYRVELLLNSRTEVRERLSKHRQFVITAAVGIGSMAGTFLAIIPFK
ncbi:hypothetical protein ABZ806_15440 [Spirillospora sp. NPDC047418]|jgi:hypothetical protein